jgi:hypothetical protein
MKYLVILLVLAAGGISGYFIGSHQGKGAIEALAGKEKKIREQTAKMNNNQREIERLRNNAVSATDPAEKRKLLERVAQLENEKRNSDSDVEGLKCLSVAVPDEILGQLQGKP